MSLIHRRLKRISLGTSGRQLFAMVGVLLVIWLLRPDSTSAQVIPFDQKKMPSISLNQDKKKIQGIKITFEFKKYKVEEAKTKLEVVSKEVEKVSEVKETLATEVSSIKSEVEQLQAQLAEKQRIESLRIVTIGSYAYDASGNMYTPGNCTYYAKSRRPDLPNSLGNANAWFGSAKRAGFKTGSLAKTGAVGVSFAGRLGHVVYVEKWYDNGTVLISEMNYEGLYRKSQRVAPASEFVYIYEKA